MFVAVAESMFKHVQILTWFAASSEFLGVPSRFQQAASGRLREVLQESALAMIAGKLPRPCSASKMQVFVFIKTDMLKRFPVTFMQITFAAVVLMFRSCE